MATSLGDAGANNNLKTKDGDSRSDDRSMTQEEERRMRRVYLIVFLMLFLDLVAFTVILPLFPSLMTYYGSKDRSGIYKGLKYLSSSFRSMIGLQNESADEVFLGGFVSSLFSFFQFLSSPIIGAASDVYGRRRMMMICMVGVALSYVLWMFSRSFLFFVFARFIGGISKGNISLSTAIITDVSNKEKRPKGMALIGIAFSLGFIIGPMVGAYFSSLVYEQGKGLYYMYPALFAFTLAVIDIVFIYFFLEETLPESKQVQNKQYIWENAGKLISPMSIFTLKPVENLGKSSKANIQRINLIYFVFMFIYSGLEFTLPFLMAQRYAFNSQKQGMMFTVLGVMMALVQGGYTRRVKPGQERKMALRGIMFLLPAYFLLAISHINIINFLAFPLFAFASATVVPCMTTMVSIYGREDQKGVVLGIFRSLGSIARATGPMFFSSIFWLFGEDWCYSIGCVSVLIPLFLFRGKLLEKERSQ